MKLQTKIVLGLSPLVVFAIGGWIAWSRSDLGHYSSALPEQLKLADEAGMTMTSSAIIQRIKRAGSVNPAPFYILAVPLMEGNSQAVKAVLGTENWAEIETLVNEEQPCIRKMRRLSMMPAIDFNRDWEHGWNINFRELGPMRTATLKFDLEAQLLSHQGKVDAAIKDIEASIRIGDQVAVEPILIAQLISLPIKGQALKTIRQIAIDHPDHHTLERLRKLVLSVTLPDMHGALQSEAFWSVQAFTMMANEKAISVDNQNPLPLARFKSIRDAYSARGIEEYRKTFLALPKDPNDVSVVRTALEDMDKRMQSTEPSMKGIAVVAP